MAIKIFLFSLDKSYKDDKIQLKRKEESHEGFKVFVNVGVYVLAI
jgi:hypothetical protein